MVYTRVIYARVPEKIHRRVQVIAQEQQRSMADVVAVALTEFAERFQPGERIELVRR